MIGIVALFAFWIADEPVRAIHDAGIQMFIESRRTANDGPGKILVEASGQYDRDPYADKLVVYTYEQGPNSDGKAHGMFAVAFLTENLDTTDVLFIPEAESVPEKVQGYSSSGNELTITGRKHLPGDPTCCPSAIVSVTLSVIKKEIVVLKGVYRRQPKANE